MERLGSDTKGLADMKNRLATAALLSILAPGVAQAESRAELDALIEAHARAQNVPSWVVHRVVKRESNYNPRARGGSALGLMQIKHPTARGVGYRGDAAGLYDAGTNLKYGVAYLAGAWRLAGGNYDVCYRHYQRGYYYSAKQARLAPVVGKDPIMAAATPAPAAQSSFSLAKLFGLRQDNAPAAAPASGSQALAYAATPGAQPAPAAQTQAQAPAAQTQAPAALTQADLVEVPVPPRRPAASAKRAPSRLALARKQPKEEAVAVAETAAPAHAAPSGQAASSTQSAAAAQVSAPAQAAPAAVAQAPAVPPGQTASMFATPLPAPAKAPVQEASAASGH